MDFIKTGSKNRETYTYTFMSDGQKKTVTLVAGQDDITKEWIDELHRADDRTVYSNNKNANPDFRKKTKTHSEKKWNTSLDSPKPSAYDVKKGKFVEQSVVMPASYETPEQELLNDCLEKLSADEARFLRRVVKHGEATKLAEEYHVSNKTINAWKNKLINKIKKF
ncbi:hypothetical protein BABA_12400 [Neobacillus bataviensis LMG 21833]|uniref:Uncharacterized protein n=1 Tax=Neobacillus bataviensis LMG 21833 TaxID=1117379 RepID=K6CAU0_9BACI|nr:hypothetical protein [Neobacillus bataviensis]EKN68250.1 hypothetical protein BABA_12400 [Neobacillus bataviensis LMG 21833]EQC56259.1 hypothetical protein LLT5_00165 [Lactococcus cremoris subsp. cremoris TIFN5]KUL13237.1 hypothetical protein LI7559_07855 [Bacillus licheniformis LMG 7559]